MWSRILIGALILLNYGVFLITPETRSAPPSSRYVRPLWIQTELIMHECGVKMDTGIAHFRAKQIARIAEAILPGRDTQESYIVLLCIESQYNPLARSKVGALGISQIMPAYSNEFAKDCVPGTFSAVDLLDAEVGITLGACRFKALMGRFGGNVALALAGYNSGVSSPTTRKLARGSNGAAETDGYLARYLVMQEKLK